MKTLKRAKNELGFVILRLLVIMAALAALTAIIIFVGEAEIAYAAVPSSSGVINACYDREGTLRVIDAESGETCRMRETPIEWNQQGAPSAAFSTDALLIISTPDYMEFVHLSLPVGKYLIVGTGVVLNQKATSSTAVCRMMSGTTEIDVSVVGLPAPAIIGTASYGTLAFSAPLDLPTGGAVSIACYTTGAEIFGKLRLSAHSVTSLTLQ